MWVNSRKGELRVDEIHIEKYLPYEAGGDGVFDLKISVLFDRSIENYFSASGIWGLVNLVSFALLKDPRRKM